jgi:integrase
MVAMRLSGINTVRAKGRIYYYHRQTGTRIPHPPGSAEFVLFVERLNRAPTPAAGRPGTLGALVLAYKRSPEFRRLAPRTQADYERVFGFLVEGNDQAADDMTAGAVLRIRDKAYRRHKRRFANYVVQVLRLLFAWAKARDLVKDNPAAEIELLRRAHDEPRRNRPWTLGEVWTVLDACPAQMKEIVALGAFTGMREGDAIRFPRSGYDGEWVSWIQGKTGHGVNIPAHKALKAVLDASPLRGPLFAVTTRGRAWTSSGFRASFFKMLRKLKGEKKIGAGLTFHGLRHTVGTFLAEIGMDARTIGSVLGHRTQSMSAHYSETADRKRLAKSAIIGLEKAMQRTKKGRTLQNSTDGLAKPSRGR